MLQGFFESKERFIEMKKLISSMTNTYFYKEPVVVKHNGLDFYSASVIVGNSNDEKKIRKLRDKWRVKDIKNGVLEKVVFGYSPDWIDKWYISEKNFNELVALGLKVKAPLHHGDALRFLEGICNGAVYTDDCESHSDEMNKRVNDKFKPIWDDPNFKHTAEHCYEVAHYCVDVAIDIVKEIMSRKKNNKK